LPEEVIKKQQNTPAQITHIQDLTNMEHNLNIWCRTVSHTAIITEEVAETNQPKFNG